MSLSQSVNPVVGDNIGHIDVSSEGMDKMTEPDRVGISIPTKGNNRKLGVGKFHPLSNGKNSSMQRMKSVRIKIAVQSTMTADAGNNAHLFRLNFKIKGRLFKRRKKAVETAASTPSGILKMIVFQFKH